MPIYSCNICNISTRILTHYNRHLITAKHLRNIKVYDNTFENIEKKNKKEPKRAKKSQNIKKYAKKSQIFEF